MVLNSSPLQIPQYASSKLYLRLKTLSQKRAKNTIFIGGDFNLDYNNKAVANRIQHET